MAAVKCYMSMVTLYLVFLYKNGLHSIRGITEMLTEVSMAQPKTTTEKLYKEQKHGTSLHLHFKNYMQFLLKDTFYVNENIFPFVVCLFSLGHFLVVRAFNVMGPGGSGG